MSMTTSFCGGVIRLHREARPSITTRGSSGTSGTLLSFPRIYTSLKLPASPPSLAYLPHPFSLIPCSVSPVPYPLRPAPPPSPTRGTMLDTAGCAIRLDKTLVWASQRSWSALCACCCTLGAICLRRADIPAIYPKPCLLAKSACDTN